MTANVFKETVQALRQQGLNSDEILERLEVLSDFFLSMGNTKRVDDNKDRIRRVLKNFCMPVHYSGYRYWIDALIVYQDNKEINMSELYDLLAQMHDKTWTQVERAMRNAREKAFGICSKANIDAIFEYNISVTTGTPTNEQFLVILSELI